MSVDELRAGMRWLSTHLYSREALEARRRPFFDGLRQEATGGPSLGGGSPL